ncbi:hypothetical protein GCM10022382_32210 [Microbacterium invictum]
MASEGGGCQTDRMGRGISLGALLLACVVALTGCSIPPVTTHARADGSTVSLAWADYPGHAYVDADDILATPGIDEIEAHGHALIEAIQAEVAAETGIHLTMHGGEGQFHGFDSNGYGSPTLLTSYSCCSLVAEAVPAEFADWMRVYGIVARISAEFGAGPMIREQDQEWVRDDPEQLAEFETTWTTGVEGEYSLLSAWTTGSGQSVMLTMEDPARRLAASDAEKETGPRFSVDYSATVIERGKRAEFEERLAPFAGAEKPDSTEWEW